MPQSLWHRLLVLNYFLVAIRPGLQQIGLWDEVQMNLGKEDVDAHYDEIAMRKTEARKRRRDMEVLFMYPRAEDTTG